MRLNILESISTFSTHSVSKQYRISIFGTFCLHCLVFITISFPWIPAAVRQISSLIYICTIYQHISIIKCIKYWKFQLSENMAKTWSIRRRYINNGASVRSIMREWPAYSHIEQVCSCYIFKNRYWPDWHMSNKYLKGYEPSHPLIIFIGMPVIS